MRIRFAVRLICLFLLFDLLPATNAQTVNGNNNAAFAVGKWKESHEGLSLFCALVTTQKNVIKGNSNGVCFLTETQASAIKYVLRLVLNFETHQMTKFVEASTGNTVGYHLADQ